MGSFDLKNYVEFLVKDPELINIFLCPESTANFDNKRIEQVKKSGILHCFIELLIYCDTIFILNRHLKT